MEPLFINSAQIYIGLISIYYRHRCQTGYKAMEEQKLVTKWTAILFLTKVFLLVPR